MSRSRGAWLLALATVLFLWLAGVIALGGLALVGAVLTLPGLVSLGLCARQVVARRYDAVAPWACCALAPLPFLAVISLGNIHLHEFTGVANCDYMAQTCSPQPLQGIAHMSGLVCFIATGIVIVRVIAGATRRSAGELKRA